MFIRVRGATPGDPLHEFDVSVDEVARYPNLYEVLDGVPVSECRPPVYVQRPVVVKVKRRK